jgi:hypothetical protein
MMRGAGAPPPPKGKVRQLYPPPPPAQGAAVQPERYARDGPDAALGDEAKRSSMFIDDAAQIDERRRKARERLEARERPAEPFGDGEEE